MSDVTLLLRALLTDSPQVAELAWRRWRQEVDLQQLSWSAVQLIPLLDRTQWASWVSHDSEAALLRGIARRAWTESHLILKVLRSCTEVLARGGVSPTLPAGPCAVFLQNARQDSVRPLSDIQVIIPRRHLFRALQILATHAWTLCGPLPKTNALHWATHVTLHREGLTLKLFWRHLNVPPWRARDCEESLFASSDSQMSPEHLMLSVLQASLIHPDTIPWQADACLVNLSAGQWQNWTKLANRWTPCAFPRLAELRQEGAPVPDVPCLRGPRAIFEDLAHQALRGVITPLHRRLNQLRFRGSASACKTSVS